MRVRISSGLVPILLASATALAQPTQGEERTMKTCDFSRSFVTFVTRGRGNNALIQVEARCAVSSNPLQRTSERRLAAATASSGKVAATGIIRHERQSV